MAMNSYSASQENTETKISFSTQRRCILLAIIGSTPPSSASLRRLLFNGLLFVVKSWLDDILNGLVGGVDLLLHLLKNITMLPVTKEMVTTSKLGKAVAAVERHSICTAGKNESIIKQRISDVKHQWSASVKINKQAKGEGERNISGQKRPLENLAIADATSFASSSKRAKTEDSRGKTDSLSRLIKKVSSNDETRKVTSSSGTGRMKSKERDEKVKAILANMEESVKSKHESEEYNPMSDNLRAGNNTGNGGKQGKRIHWADKSGGSLSTSHVVEIVDDAPVVRGGSGKFAGPVSWSDRKKRDRMREKELLERARKSKITDKDDTLNTMMMLVSSWRMPQRLPMDPNNPPLQPESKELNMQIRRVASVPAANYHSEDDVPINPTPLTDIEQALDMNSQSSSRPLIIPFFSPQQEQEMHVPTPTPVVPQQQNPMAAYPTASTTMPMAPPPMQTAAVAAPVAPATIEILQSLGLPLFLVGQNVQALQTLAGSPSLLNTFVDANGMYDQARILNLVQTLTQNLAATLPIPQATPPQLVQPMSVGATTFQGPGTPLPPPPQYAVPSGSAYQAPPQSSGFSNTHATQEHLPGQEQTVRKGGYRGDQNSEGNLHLSGYGPSTTQAEIVALFSPYVQITEVVQKNGFCFVNTRDPAGARRSKEALNGTLLGGSAVKINIAMRRAKDPAHAEVKAAKMSRAIRSSAVPLPKNALGQIDYDQVRDDRGNPATKNLFVAGYGHGTSERQLREIFGEHASVTGVILKGSFAFVNTSDRMSAVHAREALIGSVVNGGVLRINFAKESGRLGTSFDTTYGPGAQQNRYGRSHTH